MFKVEHSIHHQHPLETKFDLLFRVIVIKDVKWSESLLHLGIGNTLGTVERS